MDWKFEEKENEFKKVPAGKHRLRIESAVQKVSKSGRDMVELTLAISGYSTKVWYYLVFLEDYPDITNRNLTAIYDSFGIEKGNMNFESWVGKVGAGQLKYDENEYLKVHYFIKKEAQTDLPSWVEPNSEEAVGEFVTVEDPDDLPF